MSVLHFRHMEHGDVRTSDAEHSEKNFIVLTLLSLFFGYMGFDRFYLGKIGTGILKLIFIGGFGIWWIIDLALILSGNMRDSSGKKVSNTNNKGGIPV